MKIAGNPIRGEPSRDLELCGKLEMWIGPGVDRHTDGLSTVQAGPSP